MVSMITTEPRTVRIHCRSDISCLTPKTPSCSSFRFSSLIVAISSNHSIGSTADGKCSAALEWDVSHMITLTGLWLPCLCCMYMRARIYTYCKTCSNAFNKGFNYQTLGKLNSEKPIEKYGVWELVIVYFPALEVLEEFFKKSLRILKY